MACKEINRHNQKMVEHLSINKLMETKTQLQSSQNNLKHKMEKNKAKIVTDTEGLLTPQEVKTTREELTQRINS